MVDRLKQIPTRLLELWNKYTRKQKTIFISIVAVIIIALVIVLLVTGKKNYTNLTECKSVSEASKVVELLKDSEIEYYTSSDQLTIYVDSAKKEEAVFLLAGNGITTTGLTMEQLLNNSLSTTNSDRTLKVNLYFQNQVKEYLTSMEGIDDATLSYIPSETGNSLLSENINTTASVMLKVNDDFKNASAKTIAKIVAAVIGNSSTEGIIVADQYGNLLFGAEDDLTTGTANNNEEFKEKLRNSFKNRLYAGLMKLGYTDVEVMPNLNFNMDVVKEMYTEYTAAEGQEQGLYSHSYTQETQNTAGTSGGVAGTASNDETSYLTQNGNGANSSTNTQQYDYLPNTRVTNTDFSYGDIVTEESSVSIVMKKMVQHTEEELKLQNLLEDTTFEEYALANKEPKEITIDDSVYQLISNATGISIDKITVVAYEQPLFIPDESSGKSITDYLPIILAVIIIGLLVFIVIKSAAPVEVTETEPELSVEELLATTKENQEIEDIEFEDKSETRKMIEKFVDENPEAVANLLRNWLSDDWD